MPSVERSLNINAPSERVYQAFLDLSRWLEWNPHMREVRPLSDGPLAQGSRARLALKRSPFASTWEVTEVNPGRSFAWKSSSVPGVRLLTDHIVESADGGTRATLRIHIEGPLAFLTGPAAAFYRRNLGRSLAALKAMLEREAPPAPEPQQPPAEEPEAATEAEPEGGAEAEGEAKNE